jgi:hypothetical protein
MPGLWNQGNSSSTSMGSNGSDNNTGTIMDTAIVSQNGSASDVSGTAASSMRLRQRRGAAASIIPPSSPPPGSRSSTNNRAATTTTTGNTNGSDDDDNDNAGDEEEDDDDDDNRSTSSALSFVARAAATAALAALSGSSSSLSHSNHNAITTTTSNSAATTSAATTTTSLATIFQTNIPRLCVAFLASITTGGTTYAFGLYGNALKKNLHLTQSELDTISTANFCAGALSWIPGLLVDYFGTRFGISMGGILCSMALMMYWHVAKHGLDETGWILSGFNVNEDPSITTESVLLRTMVATTDNGTTDERTNATMIVATLSALGVMIFLSCSLITGSVFKIIVNSCGPGSKGNAVGIAKAYVGLGAGAYACFFESIRQPETTDLEFLPMCAVFFLVAAVVPSLCILPTKQQELERQRLLQEQPPTQHRSSSSSSSSSSTNIADVTTPRHFRVLFTSLFAMASIIVGNSLLTLYRSSSYDHRHPPLQGDIIVGMEEEDDDDNLFDGTADDQYDVAFNLAKMQTATNTGATMTSSSFRGPNYPLALLLLLVWIAPIVSLLFLPPSGGATHRAQGTDEAYILNNEERESLLHLEDPPIADDQGATAAGDTKRRTKTMGKSSSLSSSTSDPFPSGDVLQQRQQDDDDVEGDSPDDDDQEEQIDEAASNNGNNKNLLQMLFTPAAWFMLFTTTILVGGGTVETNNLGQMVESLRFPEIVTPAALALFSVAQSLSRALTGALSETALNSYTNCKGRHCGTDHGGVPRTVFLIAASVAGFVAHSLLAISTTLGPFVVGVFLSGAAFGMVWPLMVLIVGEVFGTAHMAANYMFFDGFTSAGGTLLLSKVVAQEVYERHILNMFVSPTTDVDISAMINVVPRPGDEEGNEMGEGMRDDTVGGVLITMGDGVTCYGHECFRLTHVIIAGLSLLCVVTSIAMQYVTRHIYNKSSRQRH